MKKKPKKLIGRDCPLCGKELFERSPNQQLIECPTKIIIPHEGEYEPREKSHYVEDNLVNLTIQYLLPYRITTTTIPGNLDNATILSTLRKYRSGRCYFRTMTTSYPWPFETEEKLRKKIETLKAFL